MFADEFKYNTETYELERTGSAGGETTQSITIVNGEGTTNGIATAEGNTLGSTNQSQVFDTLVSQPKISLKPTTEGESKNPAGSILKAGMTTALLISQADSPAPGPADAADVAIAGATLIAEGVV